jgi:hypothetical protein
MENSPCCLAFGKPMTPYLFCYQALEVENYSCRLDDVPDNKDFGIFDLHLWQT